MALSIRNPRVERLARELSALSGMGMTDAIGEALEARLDALDSKPDCGLPGSARSRPLAPRPQITIRAGRTRYSATTQPEL